MFSEVKTDVRFPDLEEQVLELWRQEDVFKKSLALREDAPEFIFYEGPPTANGKPGVHHVQARAYKDLFPRYKTMKGFLVRRKAGWDCHGLPVELEVEKRLGMSGKKAIEEYGVEAFNQQCRASVMEYEGTWRRMTERIGFWIDLDDAYMTMSNEYVESVWWSLKQLWDKGLVYLGYKVVPYCPRCGTPLSSHEVGLGYKDVVDPSITIRMPVKDHEKLGLPESTSLLVWTTTPWTLPGNVACAIHPDLKYLAARKDGEVFILAEALADRVLGENAYEVVRPLTAQDLEGVRYQPPYPDVLPSVEARTPQGDAVGADTAWRIVTGDFVTAEDGTGIVHIAPAFGADDMEMARRHGLPVLRTVADDGRFIPEVALVSGEFFQKGNPVIMRDLKARGVLFHKADYQHSYPHCWRCDTALMYYATNSWFIRNTSVKDQLIAKNQQINWIPSHIKNGRYGDWLNNLVDWALSRSRYWGSPLPIWICDSCDHQEMVGSFAELAERAEQDVNPASPDFDPHRPYVDRITFKCRRHGCAGTMKRVLDVIDCWYDSGAMPYAQLHYPFENQERFKTAFPADFICEGLDQTRGWFNSLHQLGVMLFDHIAYRNVICHGLVLDEKGEKMSKRLGNIVDPWDVLDAHGADALRWYLYASAPPEFSRRFSVNLVGEAVRGYMLTLWNTYAFFVLYANLDRPELWATVDLDQRPLIDRWVISRLHETTISVTEAMDAYDPTRAARALESFVDDLSNWYVRRNRRRFWKSESDADKRAAYQTLYECLVTVSKLTAPFTPFLAEAMYQNLVAKVDETQPKSVHLCDYPAALDAALDKTLLADMRVVIDTVSVGRNARATSKVKTRQPLSEAVIRPRSDAEVESLRRFSDQVMEELNVRSLRFLGVGDEFVNYKLLPKMPEAGKKYRDRVKKIAAAFASIDGRDIAKAVEAGRTFVVALEGGESVEMEPGEVIVNAIAPDGFAGAEEGGRMVALDTRLTPELVAEGQVNDIVRLIQDSRKQAGFHVSDSIRCWIGVNGDVNEMIQRHRERIEGETLSSLELADPPGDAFVPVFTDDKGNPKTPEIGGQAITLGVRKLD